MGTKYPEIFAALGKPIPASEVKILKKGGMGIKYITARTAMNRLDDVLGPENWWDEYAPGAESVLCKLTIRLPDGSTVTKADAGGYAGMADQGDDDKSGYSDAFKRACVKCGLSRELYGNGVAGFISLQQIAENAELVRSDLTDMIAGFNGAFRTYLTSLGLPYPGDFVLAEAIAFLVDKAKTSGIKVAVDATEQEALAKLYVSEVYHSALTDYEKTFKKAALDKAKAMAAKPEPEAKVEAKTEKETKKAKAS